MNARSNERGASFESGYAFAAKHLSAGIALLVGVCTVAARLELRLYGIDSRSRAIEAGAADPTGSTARLQRVQRKRAESAAESAASLGIDVVLVFLLQRRAQISTALQQHEAALADLRAALLLDEHNAATRDALAALGIPVTDSLLPSEQRFRAAENSMRVAAVLSGSLPLPEPQPRAAAAGARRPEVGRFPPVEGASPLAATAGARSNPRAARRGGTALTTRSAAARSATARGARSGRRGAAHASARARAPPPRAGASLRVAASPAAAPRPAAPASAPLRDATGDERVGWGSTRARTRGLPTRRAKKSAAFASPALAPMMTITWLR